MCTEYVIIVSLKLIGVKMHYDKSCICFKCLVNENIFLWQHLENHISSKFSVFQKYSLFLEQIPPEDWWVSIILQSDGSQIKFHS